MSNKIALATIQFRADAKGANVALDSLRASAKDARKTVDDLQEALNRGIKTMTDANGVKFDVEAKLKAAKKEAKSFEQAISELMKGATALESVVKNIRMGEIEKNSRAELKGAINAAQSRLRSIREKEESGKLNEEDLRRQRDLNKVIEESQKQLNRLDRDTAKVIETLSKGRKVSEATLKKEQEGLEKILTMIPKGTAEYKQYAAQLKEIQTYVANIQAKELERSTKLLSSPVLGRYSEEDIRKAISAGKELLSTYRSGSKEAQALSENIVKAETYLKNHGVEAARAAQRQAEAAKLLDDKYKMMQGRMDKLNRLSQGALTETQKFWEAQRDGATRGSQAYREAVGNLKAIATEQERLNTLQQQDSAKKLNRKNLRTMSESELRQSVAAAKELLAAMKPTDKSFKQLQDSIIRAEEHIQKFGLEAERSAQKAAAQLQMMNGRMSDLSKLSDGALEETKRFWQAQMDGAERSSQAYNDAKAKLEAVIAEQQKLADKQAETGAKKLTGGNLMTMSERDIRKAIEDAKKYQQTLSANDSEYKQLSKSIADAEDHIRKYGLEAERTARKEMEAQAKLAKQRKDTDALMEKQLRMGMNLSKSALQAQQQYWQRLIDDPKTAVTSLKQYEANLQKVKTLLEAVAIDETRTKGQAALRFFRGNTGNASADLMRENLEALKKYRDSLPKKTNADLIAEINSYIEKTGAAAKVAAGEAMTMKQALQTAMSARSGNFKGTVEQLTLAKKTLEELQQKAVKGGLAWRRLQEGIDSINLELKRTGMTAKEVQAVLDNPKGKSFNELKIAVEQGRIALAKMRTETVEDRKAFDELAAKVKEADIQMKQLGNSSKGTATAFDKAWSRLKTYIGLYVGAAVAMQKLVATMGDLMDLSDKMGEVRKTTGFTAEEVGKLSESLKKLDTRTTITGLLDLSVAAGQLGLKTQEDVEGFTIAANKLMVALPEMGKEGATEMLKVALATGEIAKIGKQMKEGLIEGSSATAVAMEKVGSTIDRLRATSAATAPAITDFVKRVGAVGAQSGITIDQVAALGSTVDALGMRVEMSATALSRMIPAIKNNAFDIAKAIGVTPDTLRNLFETGRGMEAILMIFQHIKDSGMDEDSVEQMLGMGNMKEIMKELNQQGARAGIVFAGLSQNVDELRRQLGVAAEAYEENIAIQQEYDKMNETTAAKLERLKNQLEEMFVGDKAQRFFGGIIDNLRTIVDIVANAYNTWMVYLAAMWGAFKAGLGQALFTQLPKALTSLTAASGTFFKTALAGLGAMANSMGIVTARTRLARMEWNKLDVAMKQNLWGAVIAGLAMLVYKLYEWKKATAEAMKEQGRLAAEIVKSEQAVDKNFKAVDKAKVSVDEANKKLTEAQKALEKARKEMDGSKKSADSLTKAEEDLKKAEDDVRMANDAHRASIEQINKQYGGYLGFMLSEISSAAELANARELINSKLRETITLKRKEAALGRLEEGMGEDRDKAYGDLSQSLQGAVRKERVIGRTKDKNGKIVETKAWGTDEKATEELLRQITKVAQDEALSRTEAAARIDKLLIDAGKGGEQWEKWRANIRNKALDYQKEYINVQKKVRDVETQFDVERQVDREDSQKKLSKQYKEADKNYADLEKKHADAQGDAKKKAAANLLKQMDSMEEMIGSAKNYYDLTNASEKKSYDQFVKDTQTRLDGMKDQRDALLKEAGSYYKARKTVSGSMTKGGEGGGLWGSKPDATSTDYSVWDVDELVARRNQMDKFKNVLKPDTNIREVLAEDKALMKALNNGLKEDWKSVMDWYNQERKKIEQELKSERFSTNEGHWAAEAKTGKRKNMMPETDYALAELDRYYSRRKEELEKARIDENMSEELYNRQAELLEQEHLERRAKLRGSFTGEISKEETKAFDEWWKALEKNFELDKLERDKITAEWAKANAGQIGRNNYRMQQDMTKMEEITVKHLNRIAAIVAKERPYDGIVENLRKNLTEMDILFADMEKKGETDPAKLVKAEAERMRFLLSEAENAYALTFDELAKKMREKGMGDWADSLIVDDQKRQSILEALHKVYDDVQNAIKKEAAQIKKNVDIMWQDVMPGKNTSLKDSYELAISSLGLEEGNVSRANSLIGAGAASERVVDKLAIQQMKLKITMQEHYYNLIEAEGRKRIAFLEHEAELEKKKAERLKKEAEELKKMSEELKSQGKLEESQLKAKDAQLKARKAEEALTKSVEASLDKQHLTTSLNISQAKELTEIEKQRNEILARTEESQNRLYRELREWGDLIASSLQGVMEASNAGNAEYYNERAKMDLTGKGGPGAGTYIIIEDEGTSDATAHYEYLDERAALERQHEIEQQNAQAEAWKKLSDDLNMKMSEQITDWMNAAALDANTAAVMANTDAILRSMEGSKTDFSDASKLKRDENGMALDSSGSVVYPIQPTEEGKAANQEGITSMWQTYAQAGSEAMTQMSEVIGELPNPVPDPVSLTPETAEIVGENAAAVYNAAADAKIAASERETEVVVGNAEKQKRATKDTADQEARSTQSSFSKMIAACNLYGIAYQTMSNENLSTAQKFQAFALQAAGQAAISALTMEFTKVEGENTVRLPGILGKLLGEMPYPAAMATFAGVTALMGTMMALAMSAVTKSKSQISQVTGASASAGRLATGMMTYAEGNVNEFTDPSTLTPGRQYNVDGADGRTYRAKYTGTNPSTHLTNGPEFHLAGERGREMIIDAGTTRQITMNENEIWHAIQTLSAGGRMPSTRRRGRGVRAFADGNVEDFESMDNGELTMDNGGMDLAAMQASLDRNSAVQEALLERLNQPIYAQNILYGPDGLPNVIAKLQKEAKKHGEKYL